MENNTKYINAKLKILGCGLNWVDRRHGILYYHISCDEKVLISLNNLPGFDMPVVFIFNKTIGSNICGLFKYKDSLILHGYTWNYVIDNLRHRYGIYYYDRKIILSDRSLPLKKSGILARILSHELEYDEFYYYTGRYIDGRYECEKYYIYDFILNLGVTGDAGETCFLRLDRLPELHILDLEDMKRNIYEIFQNIRSQTEKRLEYLSLGGLSMGR